MRTAVLLLAALALTGCGTKKPSAYSRENTALLARIPVFPGAAAPKTTAGVSSSVEFGARDWTLPAHLDPETVIAWYVPRLQRTGWRITGKDLGTIRAARRSATVVVGVRGRTLEVIANARGV